MLSFVEWKEFSVWNGFSGCVWLRPEESGYYMGYMLDPLIQLQLRSDASVQPWHLSFSPIEGDKP